MTQRKCSSCGKDAFAYRLEADGARTYLCAGHIPQERVHDYLDSDDRFYEAPDALNRTLQAILGTPKNR
jgi:hypothetical protein